MQDFPQSLNLTTLVYMLLASFLGAVGGWFGRRKREPLELDKLRAETRQIHTSSDTSLGGITLETFREIQSVIQKAEDRRSEWQAREDELRSQIRFWRCKSEELDGELIDSREANGVLQSKLARAEDEAKAARLFVRQLNAAAKLTTCEHHPTGVKLSDYTPQQLNPAKE